MIIYEVSVLSANLILETLMLFSCPLYWNFGKCTGFGLLAESQKEKEGSLFKVWTNYLKNLKKRVFTKYWRNIIFVFFHGHFCSFTVIVFCLFSRASIWVSRARFCKKFHGQFWFFTRTFLGFFRFFHGHFLFSRATSRFFSRVRFGFSRGKKKTLVSMIRGGGGAKQKKL